mmetsp:Transcript_5624/g.19996  ORF Transcript_5624/g.19996 Transcript_5624/m.19996 type:complete len:139 (+) Transcript_5624:1011-1427(+)
MLAPKLPVSGNSDFWKTYFVTVLIAVTNVSAFFGRTLQLKAPSRGDRLPLQLAVLAPAGYALARAYAVTGALPGLSPGNGVGVALYAVNAFLCGFTVIQLSQLAQTACGHSHEVICPVAAQLNFLALQAAALLGVLLA